MVEIDRLTESAMKQEFPELWNLLNATFHADWRDDFASARDALDDSLSGYTTAGRGLIHQEVSGVLAAAPTGAELAHLFEVSGADLWVDSEFEMTDQAFAHLLWTLTDGASKPADHGNRTARSG
ncbi:hypothetical protein [Curtobacterium sp. VKM Ac-2852]|uniref:hypothetical protein n=1 Tax=Curtobacterium sp. VKM Ac-2852 TaxID=2739024 RepID=UPI001566B562|nr:hypothetical protein [Curtobacterium sp. VKM Ac-2852]NQX23800.1 hypothetical protein [Curtobacterium sp. VKM Ac-2852]